MAVVITANVPHTGNWPGAFARARRISTAELIDSTSKYSEPWMPAMAATYPLRYVATAAPRRTPVLAP